MPLITYLAILFKMFTFIDIYIYGVDICFIALYLCYVHKNVFLTEKEKSCY